MKRQLKRLFYWCPQPQAPNFRILRQHSKPILSLVMVGAIAISIIAASTLILSHSPTPALPTAPSATPTPTLQTTITPTPTTQPTTTPTPSPIPTPPPTWQIPNSTIVQPGEGGFYSSLVLDSSGNPHISYMDSNESLRYATYNGTSWNLQMVDARTFNHLGSILATSARVGLYSSLALDSKGYPHISYYNYTSFLEPHAITYNSSLVFGDLKYAWWNGTSWSTQTVEFGTVDSKVGAYCSLALDSQDKPHISYYEWNDVAWSMVNGNLKYASWTGTSWNIETADSDGNVGKDSSLALDSADNPHITYLDGTNGNLKYATRTSAGWNIQIVDNAVGGYCRLVLDSTYIPHISYWKNGLMYASWNGTGWSVETVDFSDNSTVGIWCSLALDSNSHPHISYVDDQNGHAYLKYASWDGTAWNTVILDTGNVGVYSSLALDSSGNPHISYFDMFNVSLKYISFDGTQKD
jgi:hypothetical protein